MSQSSFTRAKKYVASRLTGSKAGRYTITKILGKEGEIIIKALKSATTKVSGSETAKSLKVDLMKFITKCYLLHQNKIITDQAFDNIREPLSQLFFKIIFLIENIPPKEELNFNEISEMTMVVHDAFSTIASSHMKKENFERLTRICQYYSSHEFIENILYNHNLLPEKDAIAFQLRLSTQPFEQCETLIVSEMQRLSLKKDILSQMIETPDLTEFILNQEVFNLFNSWLAEYDSKTDQKMGLNLLSFYDTVYRFRQVNSRSLIYERAQSIFDKFISPSAPMKINIPQETFDEIDRTMTEDLPRKHVFDIAMHFAIQELNERYLPSFLESEQMNYLRNLLAEIEQRLQIYKERKNASQLIENEVEFEVDDDDVGSEVDLLVEIEEDDESERKEA